MGSRSAGRFLVIQSWRAEVLSRRSRARRGRPLGYKLIQCSFCLEYNVFDSGEIKSFLAGCSQNQATARLLGICLERALRKGPDGLQPLEHLDPDAPRWLREKFAAGVKFHRFVPDAALEARVRHVADWIEAARVNNEDWLQRCDSMGRPLKLLKIGSLAKVEAEADKAMRRFAFNAAATPDVEGDGEASVLTFP